MAQLTYDFPIGYDRDVTYDQILAPPFYSFELDVQTDGDAIIELKNDGDAILDATAKTGFALDQEPDGDTTPTLGHDTDVALEVETTS